MNNEKEFDFSKLNTAHITDLKQLKIVKSVSVEQNKWGRYVAKIEDFFGNTIDLTVGRKSIEHIEKEGGLSDALENASRIVLINETEDKLKFITSQYGLCRYVFGGRLVAKEQLQIKKVKESLVKKGLVVQE